MVYLVALFGPVPISAEYLAVSGINFWYPYREVLNEIKWLWNGQCYEP
jgi:hypothetical protein